MPNSTTSENNEGVLGTCMFNQEGLRRTLENMIIIVNSPLDLLEFKV